MYKAVIFDAGGVLQTYEVMEPIFQDIVETLKISRAEFEQVWKKYSHQLATNSVSEDEFFAELIRRTKSHESLPIQSLLKRKYAEFFKINLETLQIVKDLRQKGMKVAVLTNSIKSHTQHNIQAGLYDEFDVRVISNEVGMRKPDPEIYQLCLDKLGLKAEEAIMVDDKQRNLDPAEKLGITGILFISPEQLRSDLDKLDIL
jgi:putative hydrolase of the HAD superfamily